MIDGIVDKLFWTSFLVSLVLFVFASAIQSEPAFEKLYSNVSVAWGISILAWLALALVKIWTA